MTIKEFILHFIRRTLVLISWLIINLSCVIIFIFTYEPHKFGQVTRRKIRRIRKLTHFKLWMWHHFSKLIKFMHKENYYIYLENKFEKK